MCLRFHNKSLNFFLQVERVKIDAINSRSKSGRLACGGARAKNLKNLKYTELSDGSGFRTVGSGNVLECRSYRVSGGVTWVACYTSKFLEIYFFIIHSV